MYWCTFFKKSGDISLAVTPAQPDQIDFIGCHPPARKSLKYHPRGKTVSLKKKFIQKIQISAHMAAVRAAASPRPPSKSPQKKNDTSFESLLRMHQAGIFTKEEVRQLIFKKMQVSVGHKPADENFGHKPDVSPSNNVSPARSVDKKVVFHASSPTLSVQKRSRNTPAKIARKAAESKTVDMRHMVKNTTRQRFFFECTKPHSPLWHLTPGGKQTMHRILFERAAKDVVDKLYGENPVHLRNVQEPQLKKYIHWQVGRDRNNWIGKTPKRQSFHGTMPPFDFVAEKIKIEKALDAATDLTHDEVDNTVIKVEASSRNYVEASSKSNDGELMMKASSKSDDDELMMASCFTCGLASWTGNAADCPPDMGLAFPLGSSWGTYNVQPYCQTCWKEENALLTKMGGQHRAVGAKRKLSESELKHRVVSEANNELIRKAIVNAATAPPNLKKKKTANKKPKNPKKKTATKKPKKKKQLGGWRGSLSTNEKEKTKVKRWQVHAFFVWQIKYTSVC